MITESSPQRPDRDMQGQNDTEALQETQLMRDMNRVVVFGANRVGSRKFSIDLKEYLKERGVQSPNVEWLREAKNVVGGFFGSFEPEAEKTIPRGVVLFDVMRQYDGHSGMDVFTTLDRNGNGQTIADELTELCEENGVPLIQTGPKPNETTLEQAKTSIFQADPSVQQ